MIAVAAALPALALLLLGAAPPPDPIPPAVAAAVSAALVQPSARAEVVGLSPPPPAACAEVAPEPPHPLAASGRVALHFRGPGCDAWSWAEARVYAPALELTRDVRAGEPLAGATRLREQEVLPGRRPLAALPEGATAAGPAAAGAPVEAALVRLGPAPGEPLTVVVRLGALALEQPGRAVPCAPGRACALLPSGRRVEGPIVGGKLLLEVP
ncbi:hypothetical protein [Anaeromyxobacter paludicola]|uniref:Flagella basal body P-ring formation protein FlgA C-terminal domain-containing protein n=1 Tax=Anaeromyxobacter paludicola TaxID=2918171 RepID=A0ABN6N486_9BACT|nr:hypothetical protein [Anaeromyxobacter paludicola]BDG08006.1 hypothetical protein AMPC_11190 [Anaeromyxobacter paludicola]